MDEWVSAEGTNERIGWGGVWLTAVLGSAGLSGRRESPACPADGNRRPVRPAGVR